MGPSGSGYVYGSDLEGLFRRDFLPMGELEPETRHHSASAVMRNATSASASCQLEARTASWLPPRGLAVCCCCLPSIFPLLLFSQQKLRSLKPSHYLNIGSINGSLVLCSVLNY